ncbi:hypothetical protein AAG570_008122 [Ranatra chinensis]|uniref:Uncharacterized protein n=1 Tax=Ranatra chinensis TaxID=642074 RepID=A0ABD0YFM7_9HEMI
MAVCGGEPPPSPSIGLGFMSCVKDQPSDALPVRYDPNTTADDGNYSEPIGINGLKAGDGIPSCDVNYDNITADDGYYPKPIGINELKIGDDRPSFSVRYDLINTADDGDYSKTIGINGLKAGGDRPSLEYSCNYICDVRYDLNNTADDGDFLKPIGLNEHKAGDDRPSCNLSYGLINTADGGNYSKTIGINGLKAGGDRPSSEDSCPQTKEALNRHRQQYRRGDKNCSGEGKKKGFHPLRGLTRIFRRRQRASRPTNQQSPVVEPRTRSASQLLDQTDNGVHSGLSVSHDSVFCPSQHSAVSSSLSIHQLPQHTAITAELVDVVKRRRGQEENSDEEDMGLPASPVTHSPTTVDVLLEHPMKDSRTSSKISLHEKKSNASKDALDEFALAGSVTSLSHSAAKHKMAVRPKRKHAAARHRNLLVSLPVTPEVNEESLVTVTTVQNSPESAVLVKDMPSKSASLPAGVTPGEAWGSTSCDGFFTRLLARRSGKKKKNVESRQRIQPLTIPAPNVPKSQSFRQDYKLPLVCQDPPSLPNMEATCIWVSQEDTTTRTKSNETELEQAEVKHIWFSKEVTNEQIMQQCVTVEMPDEKEHEKNKESVTSGSPIDNQLNIYNVDKEAIENETSDSCNTALPKCSVVSITLDSGCENSSELTNITEENKSPDDIQSKCDDALDSNETDSVFTEDTNDAENEANSIKANESTEIIDNEPRFEDLETCGVKQEKKEQCKFEIKSITDEKKINDIFLSDRKLSLSELSSVFEKKSTESTKIVTRQKSFSFGKQNSGVSLKDNFLVRKFEEPSKVDVKTNIELPKHEKKKNENDSPLKIASLADAKNLQKSTEKQCEKKVESSEIKSSQALTEGDVILRRRPSREILKPKEEEPELLKVFARRSLKVKDVEEDVPAKSRDSDKENEDCITERKKIEYQRSVSTEDCILSIHNVCRQRSKTLPELSQHKQLNIYKEAETLNIEKEERNEEPKFIRIQQRKEEWEKRAQQAMGK